MLYIFPEFYRVSHICEPWKILTFTLFYTLKLFLGFTVFLTVLTWIISELFPILLHKFDSVLETIRSLMYKYSIMHVNACFRSNCTPRYWYSSSTRLCVPWEQSSVTGRISGPLPAKPWSFQASAIQPTLCPPQSLIDPQFEDFNVFSGIHEKFEQVSPCSRNYHTWHSTRVVLPATSEGHHMSSLLWEIICLPRITQLCQFFFLL